MDDSGLAALDQDLGDCFADRRTLRDGVKMTLALGTCAGDEIGLTKRYRLTENRSRDCNSVIEGKCANQRRWRIRVSCEMAREPGPGLQLDNRDKGLKCLVE